MSTFVLLLSLLLRQFNHVSSLYPPPLHLPHSNLSNNKLRDIREWAFDGAGGVLELLLTGNKLQGIQGRMFKGLTGLKTL